MPALSCLISCSLVAASPPSPLSHSTPAQCTSALNSGAKESLALGFMVGFSSLRKDHTRSRESKINLGSSLKFLGSKITADGDCSREIKRHLLLGRKAMTNLDSVLKSRDIIFLTNVCIVKAMVFPVVMYRCESWTIKKAEHWRIDAFKQWCWRRPLRVPCTERKSNESILKEINPEYSMEGLKLKLHYFGHLMWRADSLEKTMMLRKIGGRRRRGWQRMRWLDGITKSINMSFSKPQQIVKDREAWCAIVQEVAKSWTWLSDWTTSLEGNGMPFITFLEFRRDFIAFFVKTLWSTYLFC